MPPQTRRAPRRSGQCGKQCRRRSRRQALLRRRRIRCRPARGCRAARSARRPQQPCGRRSAPVRAGLRIRRSRSGWAVWLHRLHRSYGVPPPRQGTAGSRIGRRSIRVLRISLRPRHRRMWAAAFCCPINCGAAGNRRWLLRQRRSRAWWRNTSRRNGSLPARSPHWLRIRLHSRRTTGCNMQQRPPELTVYRLRRQKCKGRRLHPPQIPKSKHYAPPQRHTRRQRERMRCWRLHRQSVRTNHPRSPQCCRSKNCSTAPNHRKMQLLTGSRRGQRHSKARPNRRKCAVHSVHNRSAARLRRQMCISLPRRPDRRRPIRWKPRRKSRRRQTACCGRRNPPQ